MTGVEILNQFEVVTSYNPDPILGLVVLCIVFIIALLGGSVGGAAGGGIVDGLKIGAIMGAILELLFGIVATFAATTSPKETETHYQVIMSDEVTMTEFYEPYEVIDQEGKIFTVREKGSNE